MTQFRVPTVTLAGTKSSSFYNTFGYSDIVEYKKHSIMTFIVALT